MKANLICYSLGDADATVRRNFHRELYGYRDVSCNGKYVYQRKGILGEIKYKKIINGVLLVDLKNTKPVLECLKKHGAKKWVFKTETKNGL